MIEPFYPIFCKQFRKEQPRQYRKLLSNPRAEEWFAQRNPLALTKPTVRITCDTCLQNPVDQVILNNCKHTFCKNCISEHQSLYNRCPICNIVINMAKLADYEGNDFTIPSYNNFVIATSKMSKDMIRRLEVLNTIPLTPEVVYTAPKVIEETTYDRLLS